MGGRWPPGDPRAVAQKAFARQARAFSESPLQTDPRRLERLLTFLEPRPGQRTLDLACGPGIVTRELRRAGLRATGLDLTREMLREAVSQGGSFVQGDVGHLPFRDGSFDVAVCRNSFHHFADPPGVLRELARVLRPGGRAIVEDMQAPEDEAKRVYHETIERLRDVSHARTLRLEEFRTMASAAGLADFQQIPASFVIDVEEWMERAYPTRENRGEARQMLEACVENDLCGTRVWWEKGRLKFERRSFLVKAVRVSR